MEDNVASIDNYEIKEPILSSVEGTIYRAVDRSSSEHVLIKKYYPSLDWSEEVLDEFFNLAGYLRFIEQDGLLPILDMGKDQGRPYVVFADPSLILLCDRHEGQPGQKEILDFLSNVAESLDFLHKQEIVHGGLSPENIALDADGYPLLFDFGLSRVLKKLLLENMDEGFDNLSIAGVRCTSPEQIQGRHPTRASDIYTFGLISYFYIFGKLPIQESSVQETAAVHWQDGVIKAIELPEEISDNILRVIQKCIQLKPEDRFEGFTEILATLERVKMGKTARLRFKKRFDIAKRTRAPRFSMIAAGGVALALVLSVIYFGFSPKAQTAVPPASIETTPVSATSLPVTTEKPVVISLTASDQPPETTPTPATTAVQAYKLAFESEQPFHLNQPISVSNFGSLREISRLGYGKPEEAAIAPDNNHVAIATSAGVVLYVGDQFLKWLDPQGWATSVQFSPDGNVLGVGLKSGEIQLWNWQSGERSATLSGHTGQINRLLFSKSGYLYSASADQHIMMWDLNSHISLRDIAAHSKGINDIAVTSDARILLSCSDDGLIRAWDLSSGKKLYEINSRFFTGVIKAIAISSDDAYFAAGGDSGFLYQWNLITSPPSSNTTILPRNDIIPVGQRIWSLQYIRDDKELLVGEDGGKTVDYEAARQVYQGLSSHFKIPLPSTRLVDVFGSSFGFDSFSVFGGDRIISLNWDGQVTDQQSQLIDPMYDVLDRLDFSPNGAVLAAGGKRGSTHVWNLTTNAPLYKNLYFLPFGDPITPDGASIALIVPKEIKLASGNTLTEDIYQIKDLSGSQSTHDLSQTIPGANVGYTPDGTMLIAANLKISKAWEYSNGNEAHLQHYPETGCQVTASASNNQDRLQVNSPAGLLPSGDDAHVKSLCPKIYQFQNSLPAFSADMNLMVYINANGALEGYDVVKQGSAWAPYQLKSPAQVKVVAVSPDGSIVAVGNTDGRILFVDGKTGTFVSELTGNFGKLETIKFSDDGKQMATAGEDGVVRIFGIVHMQ
jgi:WD40 repeat protein/serine/threonine protein kinase